MGLHRNKQMSLIWVAISLTALSRSQNIPSITNLDCLNDFKKTMFCFWDVVGSSSNCNEDFALTYTNFEGLKEKCSDLQTEQSGGPALPNKCICNITVDFFVISEQFVIEVESHGQLVGNTTIDVASTFKLQAPSNVQIEFQEEQNGLVQWKTNYEDMFIRNRLSFHIQILFKHNREVAKENFLTQLEPRYVFSKRQLERGEDYVLRVRTRPAENREVGGTWSEWSSEVGWTNDYKLTIMDLKYITIPITCIVIICLVIVNCLCLTRYKKWWNNIPDPAKSKLAQSTLLQVQPLHPDGKSAVKMSCGKYFSRIVKAHKSTYDQLNQQHNTIDYVNIRGGYYCKKGFFEPEDEDIERCVKMYSKSENENLVQEDKIEHKVEDHLLEGDLSIAKMLFDILCESSDIKVDTFENVNRGTSFGCSGLMDSFGKKENEWFKADVLAYRESGYTSYGSDDSPLDFLSDIDRLHTSYFDQWSDNETDSMPYTPQEGLESPGLAKALYHARNDFSTDTFKALCLDSLSNNIVLCKNNSHKRLLAPKSILYYNTKHLFSHNNEDIIPKPDQASEITLHCYESKSDPTSVCHVSEYQRFDQAVQENELGCHMSGYKSFDQAVYDGGPDSACQVSGYHSFDQAVQHGDDTSVCKVIEYQSFDQAVQQNETSGSTECSVVESGCKPLEDLIFQNSEYSPKDMSENDRQYQLGESHCQIHTESPQTEKLNNDIITDNSYNKTVNSQKHELLLSDLKRILLEDIVNTTKQKYHPSKDFSDESIKALKIAVDTYLDNGLPITRKSIPFALTFDICEHLRNLESMQGHKVSLQNLIFQCHLDEVQFIQEQLISNKYLTSQKYQPTTCDNFENLTYFVPFCELEAMGSNQQYKHLLIQQRNVDNDGNSYMKLALP